MGFRFRCYNDRLERDRTKCSRRRRRRVTGVSRRGSGPWLRADRAVDLKAARRWYQQQDGRENVKRRPAREGRVLRGRGGCDDHLNLRRRQGRHGFIATHKDEGMVSVLIKRKLLPPARERGCRALPLLANLLRVRGGQAADRM